MFIHDAATFNMTRVMHQCLWLFTHAAYAPSHFEVILKSWPDVWSEHFVAGG